MTNRPRSIKDSVRILSSMQMEAIQTPTTLDMPRRLFHPVTGVVSLTSLFKDVADMLAVSPDLTIVYIHLPNSELVEDRYGWEAHEAFIRMCTNYLQGVSAQPLVVSYPSGGTFHPDQQFIAVVHYVGLPRFMAEQARTECEILVFWDDFGRQVLQGVEPYQPPE